MQSFSYPQGRYVGSWRNKPSVLVTKHLCASCDTAIITTGVGKAKTDVARHSCTASGVKTASCCTSGNGS